MLPRARSDDGFMLIEVLAAVVILSIALLGLMAGYSSAFISLHKASAENSAATLANNQLELYSSLPYNGLGLDSATLTSTKSSDATYVADETALNATASPPSSVTDATIVGCGSTPQCLPVQTLVGSNGHSYRVESFIRNVPSAAGWTERIVTVIVRDPSTTGSPKLVQLTAGFDQGPNAGS